MNTLFSQKDPRWAKKTIGTCKDTFAQSGCKITCFANIASITPDEVNKKITYTKGCLTVDSKNAEELGLIYQGRVTEKPKTFGICIAETNYYANKGVPQHFFMYNPQTDEMGDPIEYPCTWKKNKYPIVSYRLIKSKSQYSGVPTKEETLEKEVKSLKDSVKKLEKNVKSLEGIIEEKDSEIERLLNKIGVLNINNEQYLKDIEDQEEVLRDLKLQVMELKKMNDSYKEMFEKPAPSDMLSIFKKIFRK